MHAGRNVILTAMLGASKQESDRLFETLLESAPDAMVIVNERGRITLVNRRAVDMFGYPRDELLGREVEMLLPERARWRHTQHRADYMREPTLRAMGAGLELVGRRKDGSEFPVEISLSPVSTSLGGYVSSVIRDVTERKRLEGDLIAAKRQAERANKANSAFLAAASHDLRQPVQALSLLNGALRRTVQEERALAMIDSQQASLTAMTNLLNSLLDISRLDAGKIDPDISSFPIQRIIDRQAAEFARQAQQKGLHFRAGHCPAVVRSDPNLLAEIIQNFVSNAIRYTDAGAVMVDCRADDEGCTLTVSDTGIGIEQDELQAIFQEFHQIQARGRNKEGFGLGLAIVSRLADLLGHKVSVRSAPGKGSHFSIRLPLADSVAVSDEREIIAATGNGGSGLVILIEDDTAVADAWALLLETDGYRVASAASAVEADALLAHIDERPALIISDYHLLDGSTGVRAIGAIRRHFGKSLPAFIVSGDTSKVIGDGGPLDNCLVMNKPVDPNRLLRLVERATRTGSVDGD